VENRRFMFYGIVVLFYQDTCRILFYYCISASEVYYWCVNAINCTGKNTSDDLLYALGEADANMYLCSEDLRPSEYKFSSFYSILLLT